MRENYATFAQEHSPLHNLVIVSLSAFRNFSMPSVPTSLANTALFDI